MASYKMPQVLTTVLAYLLGSIPFGYLIIAKHEANIRRMLNGREKRLWGKT